MSESVKSVKNYVVKYGHYKYITSGQRAFLRKVHFDVLLLVGIWFLANLCVLNTGILIMVIDYHFYQCSAEEPY